MTNPAYQPKVHRLAVLTACVALLPIVVGALVTTFHAGMAFTDWPNSDGHFVLFYPWFQAARDQFIEHGHRLAGMVIGTLSIALAVVLWKNDSRKAVKYWGVGVLAAVVSQGVLGGSRVLLDERTLAMLHGQFASMIFTLMSLVALMTSRRWLEASADVSAASSSYLKRLAALTVFMLFLQVIAGGLVRHFGRSLYVHVAMALLAFMFVWTLAASVWMTGNPWLKRSAKWIGGLVILQVILGAGAWMNRFGYPPLDYLAVQHSPAQIFFRSGHAVCGMLLFMNTVICAAKVFRLSAPAVAGESSSPGAPSSVAMAALPEGSIG